MKNRLIGFFPLLMIGGSLFAQEQDSYNAGQEIGFTQSSYPALQLSLNTLR